jgi:hypothetical protein
MNLKQYYPLYFPTGHFNNIYNVALQELRRDNPLVYTKLS